MVGKDFPLYGERLLRVKLVICPGVPSDRMFESRAH